MLSPLTVKTHIRNIYAKLGVHTQKELIDLVEQGREDEALETESVSAGEAAEAQDAEPEPGQKGKRSFRRDGRKPL